MWSVPQRVPHFNIEKALVKNISLHSYLPSTAKNVLIIHNRGLSFVSPLSLKADENYITKFNTGSRFIKKEASWLELQEILRCLFYSYISQYH